MIKKMNNTETTRSRPEDSNHGKSEYMIIVISKWTLHHSIRQEVYATTLVEIVGIPLLLL